MKTKPIETLIRIFWTDCDGEHEMEVENSEKLNITKDILNKFKASNERLKKIEDIYDANKFKEIRKQKGNKGERKAPKPEKAVLNIKRDESGKEEKKLEDFEK